MKLKEVFEKSVQFFKDKKIETPRLDAELLISNALKMDRVQIYVKYEQPLSESEVSLCREAIRRRSTGEPVAYIMNEKGFYGEIFQVGKGVLIPRPETEIIVEESLRYLNEQKIEAPRILDLGAGSGCIGLSIIKNSTQASLVGIEKSSEAFKYLELNTSKLNLNERTQIFLSDVEVFDFTQIGPFDLIVSNPPYIAQNDPQVEENVKKFEPAQALFAEDQGLYFVKSWINKSKKLLQPKGIMFFEIGSAQGEVIKKFATDLNFFSQVQVIKDLSGLDRTLKLIR
jgi:release factor glutamine methyltransferase